MNVATLGAQGYEAMERFAARRTAKLNLNWVMLAYKLWPFLRRRGAGA